MAKKITSEDKLHGSIILSTQKICKDVGNVINKQVDPKAAELIAELVFKKLKLYADDLREFAKHAKRSVIMPDDVLLLVRRNETLKSHLLEISENCKEEKKKKKEDKTKS